jgi:hypothetical protein
MNPEIIQDWAFAILSVSLAAGVTIAIAIVIIYLAAGAISEHKYQEFLRQINKDACERKNRI